jgi:hypothetical protein
VHENYKSITCLQARCVTCILATSAIYHCQSPLKLNYCPYYSNLPSVSLHTTHCYFCPDMNWWRTSDMHILDIFSLCGHWYWRQTIEMTISRLIFAFTYFAYVLWFEVSDWNLFQHIITNLLLPEYVTVWYMLLILFSFKQFMFFP